MNIDIEQDSVSDEILTKAQTELHDFLEKNNIPKAQKMMLVNQGYILMIMTNDHKKINRMYPEFKKRQEQKKLWERFQWVVIPIISGLIITFIFQMIVFWADIAQTVVRP